MIRIDVLGYKLSEGLSILMKNNIEVDIIETYGLNKSFNSNLSDPRILKIDFNENNATVVVGYF